MAAEPMPAPPSTQAASPAAPPGRGLGWLALLGLVLGLAATFVTYLQRNGFGEDEFFQVTFIQESFPRFFSLFLRLDQHPPFHFLQLIPWAWVSPSDGWLLFNSVAWQLASCAVLWWVGRAWLGNTAGLVAAALFALMPQAISAATTLRFYSMIPALALLAWWLQVRLLSTQPQTAWRWWALALVQLALAYTHAIAFYFVFWISLAAAWQQWAAVGRQAPWRRWLLVQAVVLLLVLPQVGLTLARAWLARGSGEAVGGNNDPGNLIDHLGGMTAGWGMQWEWARVLGMLVFVAAFLLGIARPQTRRMAATLLAGPYALAMLLGAVLTPMFKTPVYSAMLLPFACLALAACLASAGAGAGPVPRWRPVAATGLLLAMMAFVFPAAQHLNRAVSPYQPLVAELKKVVQPGDVVLVPKPYVYWAVMRYAVGPAWGSPLGVLPALSGAWKALVERLGAGPAQRLGLVPQTNVVLSDGVQYVIGDDARAQSQQAARVWLVSRPVYEVPVRLAPGLTDRGIVFRAGQPELTQVRLYSREPQP